MILTYNELSACPYTLCGVNSNCQKKGDNLRLIVHIIVGIVISIMLAGILLVLTLPLSGKAQLALAAWGILLVIIGAIIGALVGAKMKGKS